MNYATITPMAHQQDHEITAAYYHGLRELGGMDEATAEELGISADPETAERHVRAGREVADILSAHDTSVVEPDTGRERWLASFHLDTGPIHRTPEQRETYRNGANLARQLMHEAGAHADSEQLPN
jgi:hypothetical protein